MHKNSKNIVVLLIVFAIALLPVRFGHGAGVDAHSGDGETISSHIYMLGCVINDDTHASGSCADHSPNGSFTDDCCGDQCSTAQTLMPSMFTLHFTPSHSYDLTWSQWLPESIISADYRPPIKLS